MIDPVKDWQWISAMIAAAAAVGGNLFLLGDTRKKQGEIEKKIKESLYASDGVTVFMPRRLCDDCRAECEKRHRETHIKLCDLLRIIEKKIDKLHDDELKYRERRRESDQAYRDDMTRKVYEASGMIAKEGGTVNQVGASAIDEDRIVNRILAAINQSPK